MDDLTWLVISVPVVRETVGSSGDYAATSSPSRRVNASPVKVKFKVIED